MRPSRKAASSSRRMSLSGSVSTNATSDASRSARHAGHDVDEAVRVRADEVDGPVGPAPDRRAGVHRRPPAPRHARVADLGAAEHPHAQVHPPLGDQAEPLVEARAPCLAAGATSRRPSRPAPGALLGRRRRARAASPRRAGAPASCSTRSGRRPASGSGRRRRRRWPAAPRACPRRCRTSAAAGPGASASSQSSIWHPVAGEDLGLLAHDHEVARRRSRRAAAGSRR